MKLGQNVCLEEISDEFENGSCWVKNYVSRSNVTKKPFVHSRGHVFSLIIMKLGENICLDEISDKIETGSFWIKN